MSHIAVGVSAAPGAAVGNVLLLGADALIYFAALAGLFRARHRIGIGAFFCALGVMHFLETYLASILYVTLPFAIVASPGSTVLFTGKLMLLLLVYIREDAVVVRQPIYGLLIGNLLLLALGFLVRLHGAAALDAARGADFGFLDQMGALMIWGTLILFADCIMMILIYERLRPVLGERMLARLALTGALVLSFDQAAFYTGLRHLTGAPLSVLFGGWLAKMAAVALYSMLGALYLRRLESPRRGQKRPPRLRDVFDLLTYRERYEDLLTRSGRDALTGALDRGRLEYLGRKRVEEAVQAGRPLSLLIIDIDHFKRINDQYGHPTGDEVLKVVAETVRNGIAEPGFFGRLGGEEFLIALPQSDISAARLAAEKFRGAIMSIDTSRWFADRRRITASIGCAVSRPGADTPSTMLKRADFALYVAKRNGRNRVETEPASPPDVDSFAAEA